MNCQEPRDGSDQSPQKRLESRFRIIDAEDLLSGDAEVIIRNGDDLYRLRKTRQGKLILHK